MLKEKIILFKINIETYLGSNFKISRKTHPIYKVNKLFLIRIKKFCLISKLKKTEARWMILY
jgi:hypothetical protein